MSRSHTPSGPPFCTDVDFVEVELPRPSSPRLVIRLSDGLSLLLESSDDVELACQVVRSLRGQRPSEGGRPC